MLTPILLLCLQLPEVRVWELTRDWEYEQTVEKGEGMNTKGLARCFGVLLVAGVSLFFMQSANATLLFSEAFNYTSGTGLTGQINPGNSTAWSSANSTYLAIGSGNLTYDGLVDLGGNELVINNGGSSSLYNTFANQTGGQIYYSFLFNASAADSGNNYFTALNPGTTAPSGSADAIDAYYYTNGKVYVRGAGASANAGTGSALTLNTTYLIVEMIDLTAKTGSLWIDPTLGDGAPTATASLSSLTATAVDNIGFKSQNTPGITYLIDNVRVGTTWADVTPVPEPSSIALAAAGLGLMMAMIRRRRS